MKRRTMVAMAAAALALGAVACGDDDATPDDPTTADGTATDDEATDEATDDTGTDDEATDEGEDAAGPCELLTEDDVTDELPQVGDLQQHESSNGCSYVSADPAVTTNLTIQRDALAAADFDEIVEQLVGVSEGEATEIDDLGDAAVSAREPAPVVFVAVNDDLLAVSVTMDDPDEADAAQIELARRVVDRL